jgi:beta-glucanase (GH16 family)
MNIFLLFVLLFCAAGRLASQTVIDTLAVNGAWCWFADPRALYYEGAQEQTYFSWVTTGGDIVIAAYNHTNGVFTRNTLHAALQADDHANPVVFIRRDGRVILFYSKHFDAVMRYRISSRPEDITEFGEEMTFGNNTTYPYPFQVGNDIVIFYRGDSDWHPTMAVSHDDGLTWETPQKFIAGGGQRPYTRYCQDRTGAIHVAFTTGHPRNEPSNKIYYACYKNGALYRADGTLIRNYTGTPAALNIDSDEAETVYDASNGKGWIWDIAVDSAGRPVMAYAAFPNDRQHDYYYARWNGKSWDNRYMVNSGGWFPQTPAGGSEPEPNYSGGIYLDPDDPSTVYLSKQVNGVFEIFKYVTNDRDDAWEIEAITQNTPSDWINVRPVVPRNRKPGSFDLIWMRGKYVFYGNGQYLTSLVYTRDTSDKKQQVTGGNNKITPGTQWADTEGNIINAHGGGILFHEGRYYWFGEHKGERSNSAWVGVTCYSSTNLYDWKYEGVVLPVVKDQDSDITEGCFIERPKVIYNAKTGKFVMYFHLELKGQDYAAARVAIAVADQVTGPYKYLKSFRPNAGHFPENMTKEQRQATAKTTDFKEWWTAEWRKAVEDGLFVRRDFADGQMSRDMTLFVDDDGKAYHIYASEENLTLHLSELSDDYLSHTGKYIRIAPCGHNEAPAIFKKDGRYFMFTSGCTGWAPNAARLFSASRIWGPWTEHPNPCTGEDAHLTFHSQSTFVLPVEGKKDAFIFMADRWTPNRPIDGRYIWLPVLFENGLPALKWIDAWDLTRFDRRASDSVSSATAVDWELVWSEEFDRDGRPDASVWTFEKGFVRNEELQWYQSDNAVCKNGILTISGRKEKIPNPNYSLESSDWRKNREFAEYTSSSIKTAGKKEFLYGRFEIRAKIPTESGSWPAIWTLGKDMSWPSCGEIDIMEYYRIGDVPHILANTAWGTDLPHTAKWNAVTVPFSKFKEKDPGWESKFHVWRMEWDENAIRLYLDDELLNETLLEDTYNGSVGNNKNPFRQPHYILLNLAIGGNGGTPTNLTFPLRYDVDYVRVYQRNASHKRNRHAVYFHE